MTKIKNLDTKSARGKRNIGLGIVATDGKALLKGFNFNIRAILSSIFFTQYAMDSVTGEVSIQI